MGGIFGVAARGDCVTDLYYGTDYHSHLGTRRGGLAVLARDGSYTRVIHNIENAQFRSKFDTDVGCMAGWAGIGCISDTEDQPLLIRSHLGTFALVTVGRINNMEALVRATFNACGTHFSEMSGAEANATELIAALISREGTFTDGIRRAQEAIDGSCSLLLLTPDGIYAARDRFGRTPLIIGEKDGAYAATMETCAFPNMDYRVWYALGPGEIVRMTPDGIEPLAPAGDTLRICTFLWVYYGYPASSYEGINVELMRNRSGAALARRDQVDADLVASIPDSGTGHAIGYANTARVPYCRPFVKYTPTWPRSFMPHDQSTRDLVARMKIIPIAEIINGKRLVFCEDSIVRGTQLREIVQRLYEHGAAAVHMRLACPPLVYGCRFLNFSRARSDLDLAARRAIRDIERRNDVDPAPYAAAGSPQFLAMVERVRARLNISTILYQTLEDMLAAVGLPPEKVCTYCWNGCG